MKKCISVLLSILLIGSLTLFILILSMGNFFTAKNIETELAKINFSKLAPTSETPGNKVVNNAIDEIYIALEEYSIPRDVTEQIIDSDFGKQVIGKVTGNIATYIMTGKEEQVLTEKDFNTLIDQNIDDIIAKSGNRITEKQKTQLVGYIKDNSGKVVKSFPSASVVANEVPDEMLQMIRRIFSTGVKIGLEIVIALCLILLVIMHRKQGKWILYTFVSLLLTGLCLVFGAFVITPLFSLALSAEGGIVVQLIDTCMEALQMKVIGIGMIFTTLSVIVLILYRVYKVKKEKHK